MAFRKKVSFLGFIVGSLVDVVGTNIWGVFITIYVLISFNLLGMAQSAPTEISGRIYSIFKTDPFVFSANLIVGSLFSILGGYIGATIAKHDELLNGALSSFLCVGSGLISFFVHPQSTSILLVIISLVLSPLLAMFGGFLRLKQRIRKQGKLAI
jgi:hypothetical protein